jgi:hypothetical protein
MEKRAISADDIDTEMKPVQAMLFGHIHAFLSFAAIPSRHITMSSTRKIP